VQGQYFFVERPRRIKFGVQTLIIIVCSEIPSNLVLRRVSPKIWLPTLTCTWGVITMCLGFVRNYKEFVTVRAILGIAEGGLLPGMVS